MTTDPEEAQIREAITTAKALQEKVHAAAAEFPPEAQALRRKLCAAADRTVSNLELALKAYLKEHQPIN